MKQSPISQSLNLWVIEIVALQFDASYSELYLVLSFQTEVLHKQS